MIDEIFEMIMKEARARPGNTLVLNINYVLLEIFNKVMIVQGIILKEEMEDQKYEI